MGYNTDFDGHFKVTPELKAHHHNYLTNFSLTRRMKRDAKKTELLSDNTRTNAGLPAGEEGGYYVGGREAGDVVDHNHPPTGQPGLWCQWVPSEDGTRIEWDGNEKFYDYEEWLVYLIKHFLAPWGYKLNGTVKWEGEDSVDVGRIVVIDNEVRIFEGRKRKPSRVFPAPGAPAQEEPTLLDAEFDFKI